MFERKFLIIIINPFWQIRGERHPDHIYEDMEKAFEQILESDNRLTKPRPQSAGSYKDYQSKSSESDPTLDDPNMSSGFLSRSNSSRAPLSVQQTLNGGSRSSYGSWVRSNLNIQQTTNSAHLIYSMCLYHFDENFYLYHP